MFCFCAYVPHCGIYHSIVILRTLILSALLLSVVKNIDLSLFIIFLFSFQLILFNIGRYYSIWKFCDYFCGLSFDFFLFHLLCSLSFFLLIILVRAIVWTLVFDIFNGKEVHLLFFLSCVGCNNRNLVLWSCNLVFLLFWIIRFNFYGYYLTYAFTISFWSHSWKWSSLYWLFIMSLFMIFCNPVNLLILLLFGRPKYFAVLAFSTLLIFKNKFQLSIFL